MRIFRTSAALLLLVMASFQLAGCATAPTRPNADKVVVILGASSGFGKGVALKLADQHANLVLAARRTQLLEELARECETRGGHAIAVTTDITDQAAVERLMRTTLTQFGRVDTWINMAGVGALGRFDEIPLADHHQVIDVNFTGVVDASYFALQQFRRQGYGTLINISSVAGRVAFPYYPTYSATKHALVGLGVALNQELRLSGEKNIHVSTVMPFASDTPWFVHAANYSGHEAQMILMDPPAKVVDAIVHATEHPRPEIAVGYKAKLALASDRISRTLTERVTADVTHKVIEKSQPQVPTAGALFQPMDSGAEVDGGVSERMAAEAKAQAAQKEAEK
jgi:short-subunit dehydrogenase